MSHTTPAPVSADAAFFLAGPTGCGKSAVALALAERLGTPAVIVNADAFQLYQGYETLSAAPTTEELARTPHALYGTLSLSENCDAARFATMARETIERIAAAGDLPIVVGGSGLYLKSLTHGLAPTPPGDSRLREHLDPLPLEALVEWYRRLDPEGAAATNLKNRRYVTRNLEITLLSGRPASELKRAFARTAPGIRAVVLVREREDLYDRINRRTLAMFAAGVAEEIRALENAELSLTAAKAIGLGEIRSLLAGEITEADAIERIQQATRRYAKRQGTWFRREEAFLPLAVAKDEPPESVAERVLIRFPDLARRR